MRLCFAIWVLFISCVGVYSESTWMPDIAKHLLEVRSAPVAASDAADEDDDYSLIVSRGGEILTSTQTETGHYRDIAVNLEAFNEVFVLDLKLNSYLLASTYIEKAITDSGEVYNDVDHGMGHCYYTGEVRGRRHSTAAISTCNGIITGYFAIDNVSYQIEPKSDDLNGRHRVFRIRDRTTIRCGTEGKRGWIPNNDFTGPSSHRMKRPFLYPQDADKVDKIVEVYVANDNSQFRARSSNAEEVYRRTKEIVNIASLHYQPLGIYLVLVGVEVWTDRDRITVNSSDVDATLIRWYEYRQNFVNPLHYNDNGVLITNVAFVGPDPETETLGIAAIGTMCSYRKSGSIVADTYSLTRSAASVLAHEMGHNFGLVHDDEYDGPCECDDIYADNECIMYSRPPPELSSKWSSCSRIQFATSFNHGLDICLYNIPPTIFQPTSQCGNGIVEDGEQCDCGNALSSECNPNCCNNNTCQLTASAACSSGRCCDTTRCQIKSSGTECRSKSDDCDFTESCNGVDARCPTDSYKPDGTDCTNLDSAYCYQGQCRSHRSQCELLWGPGTKVSNNLCYIPNHCGIRWTNSSFVDVPCNAKDVICGQLQCQAETNALYYYSNNYLLRQCITAAGNAACHSITLDFGTETQDPGLVPNGAKCGDRQMCVNQKCVGVTVSPQSTTTSTRKSSLWATPTLPIKNTPMATPGRTTPKTSRGYAMRVVEDCSVTSIEGRWHRPYLRNFYQLSTETVDGHNCQSVVFDHGLKTPDLGLVPNEAYCRDGWMCVDQKCVWFKNIKQPSCQGKCQQN